MDDNFDPPLCLLAVCENLAEYNCNSPYGIPYGERLWLRTMKILIELKKIVILDLKALQFCTIPRRFKASAFWK